MSVKRVDAAKCFGVNCQNCVNICPMDVFRFNKEANRSVIAYPENCQSCGQCYINCPSGSLTMADDMYGYAITSYRAVTTVDMNHKTLQDKE